GGECDETPIRLGRLGSVREVVREPIEGGREPIGVEYLERLAGGGVQLDPQRRSDSVVDDVAHALMRERELLAGGTEDATAHELLDALGRGALAEPRGSAQQREAE